MGPRPPSPPALALCLLCLLPPHPPAPRCSTAVQKGVEFFLEPRVCSCRSQWDSAANPDESSVPSCGISQGMGPSPDGPHPDVPKPPPLPSESPGFATMRGDGWVGRAAVGGREAAPREEAPAWWHGPSAPEGPEEEPCPTTKAGGGHLLSSAPTPGARWVSALATMPTFRHSWWEEGAFSRRNNAVWAHRSSARKGRGPAPWATFFPGLFPVQPSLASGRNQAGESLLALTYRLSPSPQPRWARQIHQDGSETRFCMTKPPRLASRGNLGRRRKRRVALPAVVVLGRDNLKVA